MLDGVGFVRKDNVLRPFQKRIEAVVQFRTRQLISKAIMNASTESEVLCRVRPAQVNLVSVREPSFVTVPGGPAQMKQRAFGEIYIADRDRLRAAPKKPGQRCSQTQYFFHEDSD